MISSRSSRRAGFLHPTLPRGSGFLLGGVAAGLLVLTVAGASLMLSGSHSAARDKATGEFGHYRLIRPQLSMETIPLAHARGVLG